MTEGINPICTSKSEWRDLGHGVSIRELRNKDGILLAIHWKHPGKDQTGADCPAGSSDHNFVSTTNYSRVGWAIVREDPLELSPSLLCNICNAHGFIRNGRWEPC